MNAIATIEPADEGASLSLEQVKRQVNLVQQIMREVMKPDEHYGTIPGCGTKPALMKAGAEKLCFTFQLVPSFVIERTDFSNGHREYHVTCRLMNRAGALIAEGVGCCSSLEPKYRYRNAARACPDCGATAIIKGKADYGGGWLCFAKKGGCGAKWPDGAAIIEKQEVGKVENPDPAECFNTILKMAKKRAQVDATITATAASDIFTQDIDENLAADDAAKAQAAPAPAAKEEPRPAPAAAPVAATPKPAPKAAAAPSARVSPTASAENPAGIGKAECDTLAIALKQELAPLKLEGLASMVWFGDCKGFVSRHATLRQAIADVRHYRSAVGDDRAASMLEDIAQEFGYPASSRSQSAETKELCAQFVRALRQGANGETPTGQVEPVAAAAHPDQPPF